MTTSQKRIAQWALVVALTFGLATAAVMCVRAAIGLELEWGITLGLAAGINVAMAVAVFLLWAAPRLFVHGSIRRPTSNPLLEAENHARTTLVGTIGGLAVIGGLFFTLWQFQETQKVSTEQLNQTQKQLEQTSKQVLTAQQQATSDRFSDSVTALSKQETEVPAIYSLDQVARDSPDYRLPVINSMSAYIHQRTPWKRDENSDPIPVKDVHDPLRTWSPGAQAALDVLGASNTTWTEGKVGEDPYSQQVHILDADLRKARLGDLNLQKSKLTRLDFSGCDGNEHTNMSDATLDGVLLIDCQLSGAHLENIRMSRVTLYGANLKGAHLEGAILEDIECDGATEWPEKNFLSKYPEIKCTN